MDRLERNLEALVRSAALPPRDSAGARRRFLRAISEPAPRSRLSSLGALAASLLVCAAIFSAILTERRDAAPPPAGVPVRVQESKPVPIVPAEQDGMVTVSITLPDPRDRAPFLRLGGKAELPDQLILKVRVDRLIEQGRGARLGPSPESAGGGITEVRAGRFTYSAPWTFEAPGRITVEVMGDLQREALKGKHAGRSWTFDFAGWTPDLVARLSPSLREVDALVVELRTVLKDCEAAVVTEASWKAVERPMMERIRRAAARVEESPARRIYPASVDLLRDTMNALTGATPHFAWEKGKYVGPKTYYAGGGTMKDFRNQDFAFDRLHAYADEASAIAGREMALWAVKELRRGGPRAPVAAAVLEQAAHAGLSPYAARLQEAEPDLSELEAEIRRGAP